MIDADDDFPISIFTPNVEDHGTVAINNPGEIVYTMKASGSLHAFIYLPQANYGLTAGLYDLNTLAGESGVSIARDITDWGVIVGQFDGVEPGVEGSEAAAWTLDNGSADMTQLGNLLSNEWSGAYAITNEQTDPTIVGAAGVLGDCECIAGNPGEENNGVEHGFRVIFTDPLPSLTELDPNEGWRNGFCRAAAAVSGGGLRIVGDQFCSGRVGGGFPGKCPPDANCEPFTKALNWTTGTTGAVLSKPNGTGGFRAFAISPDDDLVGVGFDDDAAGCIEQAWYWPSAGATPCILGQTMPSGQETHQSRAFAINSASGNPISVVGKNETSTTATLWVQDGSGSCPSNWTATDLDAGQGNWDVFEAHDVNDDGVIVGIAARSDSQNLLEYRVVMLTPIESCRGDLNDDGAIDVFDLFVMLNQWGDCQPQVVCSADINNDPNNFSGDGFDQTVDVYDLMELLTLWGDCGNPIGFAPQSIEECEQMYGDDPAKLEACIWAVLESEL